MSKASGWRFLLMGAVLGAVVGAAGCDRTPELSTQPSAAVDALGNARKVSGVIIDGYDNNIVQQEVTVTIRERDGLLSRQTRDLTGRPTATFKVTNGLLVFGVDEGAPLPLELTAIVRGSGYNTGSQDIEVTGDNPVDFQVRMVSVAKPPGGVLTVQKVI